MVITYQELELAGTGSICRFRIVNNRGAAVELTNYGARWLRAEVPDKEGRMQNVIVGYDRLEDYIGDPFYMGATVGRYANRIARAALTINGNDYQLERNDGNNCNHGGEAGFDRRPWQWRLLEPNGVSFTIHSPDGEGGWPGDIRLTAEFRWNDDCCLTLRLHGTADRPTWLNPTNHAYLNLSGNRGDIGRHLIRIHANRIVETDREYLPTGRLTDVTGTPFDFRVPRPIGQPMHQSHPSLAANRGYNHCYELCSGHEAASICDPCSGRTMTVSTSLPGLLLYSAGFLPRPHTAVCMETQYFPDTPHWPQFPSCLIDRQKGYDHTTSYRFGIAQDCPSPV